MPREMLNDDYSCLDKTDIYSLGVTALEIIITLFNTIKHNRNTTHAHTHTHTPVCVQYDVLRETGRIPLLPGINVHVQRLIQAMCCTDASCRPSARQMIKSYAIVHATSSKNE